MEIADQVLMGNWKELFRSYWSPLYPLVIAGFKLVGGAAPELIVMMWATFFCFAFQLFSFVFFAHNLLKVQANLVVSERDQFHSLSQNQLFFGMCVCFLYSALAVSELSHKTPDPLLGGVSLLAMALWLPMLTKEPTTGRCVLTGFLLGLCYWAKNFGLSLAPLMALVLLIQRKQNHLSGKKFLAILVSFVIVLSALLIPVSTIAQRFTFSDVMRVGSSWCQMFGYLKIAHGRSPSFAHPTRVFTEKPLLYEFAEPFVVSYPPSYAPQYWYEGAEARFSPAQYFSALIAKLANICMVLFAMILFIVAFLGTVSRRAPFSTERILVYAPGWSPPLLGLFICVFLLDWEGRYYPNVLVPLLCFFLACLRVVDKPIAKRCLNAGFVVLMIWLSCGLAAKTLMHYYFASPDFAHALTSAAKTKGPASPPESHHLPTIVALHKAGLKPGDRVARLTRVGDGEFYWAKGAGVKIVCESPDVDEFWNCTPEERQQAYKKLKEFGVKAIVQDWSLPAKAYPTPTDPGWTQVPGTKTYIYLLL